MSYITKNICFNQINHKTTATKTFTNIVKELLRKYSEGNKPNVFQLRILNFEVHLHGNVKVNSATYRFYFLSNYF